MLIEYFFIVNDERGESITRKKNEDLVNELIKFKEMMVIGSDGEKLGVLSRRDALEQASQQNLDLLVVAANANPPVAKILDYGRYRFETQKKAKEAKKKQHVTEIKPLRLNPLIDIGDFNTKVKQARKWIETGKKVKVDMRFRGRLITRLEVGQKTMDQFVKELSDIAHVESQPKMERNIMSAVLAPSTKKEERKGN